MLTKKDCRLLKCVDYATALVQQVKKIQKYGVQQGEAMTMFSVVCTLYCKILSCEVIGYLMCSEGVL
jgi:hypothetical protein